MDGAASTQSVEVVVAGLDPEGVARLRTIAETVIPQGERVLAVLHTQIDEVLDLIRARSASLISGTPQQPSLEELFIREVRQQSLD